jgi:hypothetical protein
MTHDREDRRAKQARRNLDRLSEQSEKLMGAGHDGPREAPDDPIELWGRRIGRSLGYLIATALLFYLLATYVFV